MSIQDRIAKRLLSKHERVLSKTGQSGWWETIKSDVEHKDMQTLEVDSVKVKFASGAKLVCEVASDEHSQIVGLQKYASLPDGYGMIFPYDAPRRVSFHMGTVPFPIDIIFVGSDGRINKIANDIEPGTRGTWGMSHVSVVIEANAGFCRENKISVGDEVDVPLDRTAQEQFPDYARPDVNREMDEPSKIDPADRFKGHDLIDEQLDGQPMDSNFDTQLGYDVTKSDISGPMRPAAKKTR